MKTEQLHSVFSFLNLTHFKIYRTSEALPIEWNEMSRHDVFLQSNYFKALEEASPTNISWFYLGIFKNDALVSIAVLQRVALYLEDIFRNHKDSCYKQKFKHLVSKFIKGNMLVVGNLMHTGQHGIYFEPDKISQAEFLELLYQAIEEVEIIVKKEHHKRIRIIMLKDYFTEDAIHQQHDFFESLKFHTITVQPNMTMNIKSDWTDVQSYLSDLNTKYRQRYKTARKKAGKIVKKELSREDIEQQSDQLYKLYKNVSDNAKINTFILPKGHFLALKRNLQDQFRVFGYYLEGFLIGFYTLILNKDTLETYFLGYDEVHQYSNQLYLNMLYDMLDFGITHRFTSIVYARTAMEIKSSIGAKPYKMNVFLKHTNPLMNGSLKQIFKLMNPKQDWVERQPFK